MLNVRIDGYDVISFQSELHVEYLHFVSYLRLHCDIILSDFNRRSTCHCSLRKMLITIRFNVALRMQISREGEKKKRETFDLQQRSHCRRSSAMKTNSRFEHFLRYCPEKNFIRDTSKLIILSYKTHLERSVVRVFVYRLLENVTFCIAFGPKFKAWYLYSRFLHLRPS